MSDFTQGNRDGRRYGDRQRRDYPDDRPRTPEPRHGGFNEQWQQRYNNWQQDGNNQRSGERDRDSGYWSNGTGRSRGVEYWARLAEDRQYQLEQDAETIKEEKDKNADLSDRLARAYNRIEDLEQNADSDQQTVTGLQQELHAVREDLQASRDDGDRLRLLLAKQCLQTGDYALATQELDPLVEARRNRLRGFSDLDRVNIREVDEAQSALYSAELIYAKALSGLREDQRAISLLEMVFKEGHRRDPYFEKPETRDTQQELCCLLERSRRPGDLDEAARIVNLALGNISRNPSAADLLWVAENTLLRTKVSLKRRDYAAAMNDAQYMWRAKSSVPTQVRQSIEQTILDAVHKLQLAGEHKHATKLTVMTLGPDSRISDAAIESLASLSPNIFNDEWGKCCDMLTAAERRRVGFELACILTSDRRSTEAINMLNSLPAGQDPPQEQVEDLLSRLLLSLGGFKSLNKAAKSANDLMKQYGYEPVPGEANSHHPKTLLAAIEKLSVMAKDREDPAKVYKDQLSVYWHTAFTEAKSNKDNISRDLLDLLAVTGRNLRTRWKENAEQKRPKTCDADHPERKAREKLLANIKVVEKWVAARRA